MKMKPRFVLLAVMLAGLTIPACGSQSSQTAPMPSAAGGGDPDGGTDSAYDAWMVSMDGDGGPAGAGGSAGQGGKGGKGGLAGASGSVGGGGASAVGGISGDGGPGPDGSAGGGGTAGCGDAGTCGPLEESGCAGTTGICVSKSVSIPSKQGGKYSIDATEVSASQYAAWIATNPQMVVLPTCSWKLSYNAGTGAGSLPITSVDWCDAYAYCHAVGKRLCGKVGGGSVDFQAGFVDPAEDQWFNACTSGGVDAFPYGNTYDAQSCNGSEHGASPVSVGSMTTCASSVPGYTGVYDLSGNVREWEDSCAQAIGFDDWCRTRGGAFYVNTASLACDDDYNTHRNVTSDSLGFRCCSP